MRKILALFLVLASCTSLQRGTDAYHDGMVELRFDPARAQRCFSRADMLLTEALKEGDLEPAETVTAVANRVRALVELDRHQEAADLLVARIPGFKPEARYEGDLVGLALLKAHHLDPERGYAHLVLEERWASSEQSRLHMAWQQARFLRNLGTARAKAEAVRICGLHAGKLDFDAMKKDLSGP